MFLFMLSILIVIYVNQFLLIIVMRMNELIIKKILLREIIFLRNFLLPMQTQLCFALCVFYFKHLLFTKEMSK